MALGACGGGGTPTPTAPSTASAIKITITGQNGMASFSPNPVSAGGQVVVFKNYDSVVHRVALNSGALDTGDIAPGATSGAVQMPLAGTYYHCSLHPTMIGHVSAATGVPPPCEGIYCSNTLSPTLTLAR